MAMASKMSSICKVNCTHFQVSYDQDKEYMENWHKYTTSNAHSEKERFVV